MYDHDKIKLLIREGKQDREVAEELNCTLNTVVYVRRKMGIIREGSNFDVLKIKELYLKGVHVAQIADKMDCSKSTVYYWLQLKKHQSIVEAESC